MGIEKVLSVLKSIILVKILSIRCFLNEWNRLRSDGDIRSKISSPFWLILYNVLHSLSHFFNWKGEKNPVSHLWRLTFHKIFDFDSSRGKCRFGWRDVGRTIDLPKASLFPDLSTLNQVGETIIPRGSIQKVVSDFCKWKIHLRKFISIHSSG